MAAAKKGIIKNAYDEITGLYGKDQIIPIILRGSCIALVYILWEVSKLEPLSKPEMKG